MNCRQLIYIILLLLPVSSLAYQPYVNTPEYFLEQLKRTDYPVDKLANAIVLYEKAEFSMIRDVRGEWKRGTKVRRVIKILTSKGVIKGDIGVRFENSVRHAFTAVSGTTYNLAGDELSITKMDSKLPTTEVVDKDVLIGKFSLPAVKSGSIIDYTYELEEDFFFQFADWQFQEDIPKLHSEVVATYNHSLDIAVILKSPYAFDEIDYPKSSDPDTSVPLAFSPRSKSTGAGYHGRKTWVRRNVPAYSDEPFVYNVDNYIEHIELQAAGFDKLYDRVMDNSTWSGVNKWLGEQTAGFSSSKRARREITELAKTICNGEVDTVLMARRIYNYVKDSIAINENNRFKVGLAEAVLENKKGSLFDVNLLLKKLLDEAGVKSNIVFLGSRTGDRLRPEFPMLERIRYIVCAVNLNNSVYYLDASKRYNTFGVLPENYYSGFGWALAGEGYAVDLDPSILKNKTVITVRTENNAASDYRLKIRETIGVGSSSRLRSEWNEDAAAIEKHLDKRLKSQPAGSELISHNVYGLKSTDSSLVVEYVIKINWDTTKNIYLIPSLYNHVAENPLKASVRQFPVEMPYAQEFIYSLNITLPDNYMATDLPASIRYTLDDKDEYKYLIEYNEVSNMLMLTTRMSMQRTLFEVDEYANLKEFYNKMITHQKKPCVLKKKI